MKRILSCLLSAVMLTSCLFGLSFNALADEVASGSCGSGEFATAWSLDGDGTITFTGSGRIPNYDENNRPAWYDYRTQIKKAVIQSGVIQIGAYALADCINLSEVDFGSIDTLGNNAFYGCTSLKHINLPSSCEWMYYSAFENCTALESAYLGANWTQSGKIPAYFFKGCTSLSVVQLGDGFTGYDTEAFANDNALTAVITSSASFPTGSYSIMNTSTLDGYCSDNTYSNARLEYHFDIQTNRLYFTGSGDMKGYENGSQPWQKFTGAVNKLDFSTTDGKTSISTTAFQGREKITDIDFTNIYAVGYGAFAECYALKAAHFDSILNQIWNYAFANDAALEQVTFEDGQDNLSIYHHAFNNCSGTTFWLNLPSNTYLVEDHAFFGTGFNYVTCTSNSFTIGEDAFGSASANQYARFFGKGSNSNFYSFVKNGRNSGYAWYYYCLNDEHECALETVEPTCTEQGYDSYKCVNCDYEQTSNYTDALGHSYKCNGNSGMEIRYECLRCGEADLIENALDVKELFSGALSQVAGNRKFMQSDYDGRVDLNNDGVINAKDLYALNAIANTADLTNRKTTVDTSTTYQTIEGFGASAAWWSQYVGTWENAEDIISMLYSKDDGIGLNIYRYNLGAGSEDAGDMRLYVADARTHCFLKQDGTYDWNNDPGAMNALRIANEINPDLRVTLFSNSAPVWMTDNGKSYCSLNAKSNLSSSRYADFANFVANCADHFIDEGYNVTAVSPINEPEWDWWGWANGDNQDSGQEGCHFEPTAARDFYDDAMVAALESNPKLNGRVALEVWESG